MRLIFIGLVLLFAGCLATEEAPSPVQNQTASQEIPATANESPDTALPAPEVSANLTIPAAGSAQESANGSSSGDNETQNAEPETTNTQPVTPLPPEGLAFGNGSYVLAFDDASIIPLSSEPCGIFSLWAMNGTLLEKMFICPGESEIWKGPEGASYRIQVIKVAAPYSGSKAWAKVIIYG